MWRRMAYGLPSPTPYHYSTWTLEVPPMSPTPPPTPVSYSPPSPFFPHPRFRLWLKYYQNKLIDMCTIMMMYYLGLTYSGIDHHHGARITYLGFTCGDPGGHTLTSSAVTVERRFCCSAKQNTLPNTWVSSFFLSLVDHHFLKTNSTYM